MKALLDTFTIILADCIWNKISATVSEKRGIQSRPTHWRRPLYSTTNPRNKRHSKVKIPRYGMFSWQIFIFI